MAGTTEKSSLQSPRLGEKQGAEGLPKNVLVAGSIGTFVEYFDLVTFGALASVMASVFFPTSNEAAGILQTFAVFALAFLARPLGGHSGVPSVIGLVANEPWRRSSSS